MPRSLKPPAESSPAYRANMEGVAAVDRALNILAAFEAGSSPLTLAELARSTGLYKSTLLRLLVSLERSRLVVRDRDQRYVLGPSAFRLGQAYERSFNVHAFLLPVMEELVASGSESASFHVRHNDEMRLCLLRVDSHHSTLDRIRVGDLLPLDRGAAGRILIDFAAGARAAQDWSMTYSSFGERDPSCGAIACPIFRPNNELLGALSLSGPLDRFTPASVKKMREPLLKAAQAATRALGGEWAFIRAVP